uniref:Rab5 GDP/GTP exchange factor n=1 Tax=Syphacia muris TaxID=451379 RepID=A0A0N5AX26_9BILA
MISDKGGKNTPTNADDITTMSDKRLRVQITEEDLLCANRCGFYGNPQWKGRCSKCWQAYQIQEKKSQDFAKNRELLSFDKSDSRRRQSTESRTYKIKAMLRKPSGTGDGYSNTAGGLLPSVSDSTRYRELSEESRNGCDRFDEFMRKSLPQTSASEISRQTHHAVDKIIENAYGQVSMDDLSGMVQRFYQTLSDKIRHNSTLLNDTSVYVTLEEIMAEIEEFVCVRTYNKLFCASSDEEAADLQLQDRIRSLHWVTGGFLETTLDFSHQAVRDKIDEAITEMIDMNSHRSAGKKLRCLVRCSKLIFEALKERAPASADEYLPVLIYVILRGNPPLIQSNVTFISRFALPSRVMSGESGYYFTNLSCALQFIQNMNAESLKMPKDEFEAYTSGRQVPPLNEKNCGCNQALHVMDKSLSDIRSLVEEQKKLLGRITCFHEQIEK